MIDCSEWRNERKNKITAVCKICLKHLKNAIITLIQHKLIETNKQFKRSVGESTNNVNRRSFLRPNINAQSSIRQKSTDVPGHKYNIYLEGIGNSDLEWQQTEYDEQD